MALTQKLKLRSGAPLWASLGTRVPVAAPARRSFSTEVLVVGAGISGALVAHALSRDGRQVTVVDRRGVLLGSTAASTALLQFEIDTPLVHLTRRIGAKRAVRAWQRSYAAVKALAGLVRTERIHANVCPRPSVYLAGNVLDATGLRAEARARSAAGLPAEYLGRLALRRRFGFHRDAAIVSIGNLNADPRALAAGILRRARNRGARLVAPLEVTDVQPRRFGVLLETRHGVDIEARHVVICTGYEMLKIVPARDHRIASTWVIATRPQRRRLWPEECLIWEASEPYLYARTTADGRVVCGGADEAFSDERHRDALLMAKSATLESKLAGLLPNVDATAEFRWTGSFGQSPTGLPSIGRLPGYRHCYAVMGYGGNGITFSMLAAQLVAAAIAGRRDPDAELFAFRR